MSTVSLRSRVVIAAPASVVWRVLGDTAAYPAWTRDVRFFRPLREGARRAMQVRLFGVPLVVPVSIESAPPSSELRWRGGPSGLFVGTHYFRVSPTPDGGAELIQGEDFDGLAVSLLMPVLRGELLRFYERTNEAVRRRAEQIAGDGPTASR